MNKETYIKYINEFLQELDIEKIEFIYMLVFDWWKKAWKNNK